MYLDGRKVGDYVIGPGFTDYDKRVPYLAFDVTDRFAQTGRKALGVILVGWVVRQRDTATTSRRTSMWTNRSCG